MNPATITSAAPATGWRTLLVAVWLNLAAVLPLFLTGAMSVQLARSFNTTPAVIAVAVSTFALTTMMASAKLGSMVGIWGRSVSLRAAGIAAVCALLILSISHQLWLMCLGLALAGLGNALGQPAGNALVAAGISQRRMGIGFAIKQSGIPVATLLGGLAVPLFALTVGWRWAYLAAALFALVGVLMVPNLSTTQAESRSEGKVARQDARVLWLLALGLSGAVVAATSIGTLGAAGGVAVGLSEATAGLLVAAGGVAGLGIRLLAGWGADRWRFDAFRGIAVLCLAGSFGWLLMAWGAPLSYAIGLVMANAFGWGWPGLAHLGVARRYPQATASASGVSQTGVAFGLLLGPALLGLVLTTVSWSGVWYVAAGGALIAAAMVWLVTPRLPSDPTLTT